MLWKIGCLGPLLTITLVAAACTDSDLESAGDEVLEGSDARARSEHVVDVFANTAAEHDLFDATGNDPFIGDVDVAADRELDVACQAFEVFDEDAASSLIAFDGFEVTDFGEFEPESSDGRVIRQTGGEVAGRLVLAVVDDDRIESGMTAILDDPDAFETCFVEQIEDFLIAHIHHLYETRELTVDVEVAASDAGDQEILIDLDARARTDFTDAYVVNFDIVGQMRLVRLGRAGLLTVALAIGGDDIDAESLTPAVDAAIEEFEARFA